MRNRSFEQPDFLQNLFDAFPSPIFVVDQDVRIFHLNRAATRLLHLDKDAVLMKKGGEILHCIHSSAVPGGCGRSDYCPDCVVRGSVGKAFLGEKIYREAAKLTLAEGDQKKGDIHFNVTASPLSHEKRKFVLLIMEDITEQKRIEEALSRHAALLETSNKDLEAFSYSVSHDLKAPLRRMDGFSLTLMEEYSGNLDARGKEYLSFIRASCQRMGQLIDDMLALSRMTLCGLEREHVDLTALAGEIAGELGDSRRERRMEFSIEPGLTVDGDRRLLRIALENLLGNAVKFSSMRPHPKIELSRMENRGERIYYVRDNGAGFDMTYADRLFLPFQRLHSGDLFPGTGIGLATVQRIIHRHGGQIWATGEKGKGATFFFTLAKGTASPSGHPSH
jgi:signal transduction histidine kinase